MNCSDPLHRANARINGEPTAILSNGTLTVLVGAGGGSSRFGSLALSSWDSEHSGQDGGQAVFVRDLVDGKFWRLGMAANATSTVTLQVGTGWGIIDHLESGIAAQLQVCVDPDRHLELRRLTLKNLGERPRVIDITGFLEIVLNYPMAHVAHPAFTKLFVQTEFVGEEGSLLARRRPRADGERWPWLAQSMWGPNQLEIETDRARFLERGYTAADPFAMRSPDPLSGTAGNVLDPAFAMRRTVVLYPLATAEVGFATAVATDRDEALSLVRGHRGGVDFEAQREAAERREVQRQAACGIDAAEAARLQTLAAAMLAGEPGLRANETVLSRTRLPVATIWGYGLAAERPHVLLDLRSPGTDRSLDALLRAQQYWRQLGLDTSLVIVTDDVPPPRLVPPPTDVPGLVVKRWQDLPEGHLDVIASVARWVTVDGASEQWEGPPSSQRIATANRALASEEDAPGVEAVPRLRFDNGLGGFTEDGSEYVIRVDPRRRAAGLPPLPWINVIASERFGCLISETGAGYTWSRNSRERRLTPWSNDPVLDPVGEALYVRDEDAGRHWSAFAGPSPGDGSYEVGHGFGYTRCLHTSAGIRHETVVFVARHDPVKATQLTLTNVGTVRRRLSVVSYQRLVLGTTPIESSRFVRTDADAEQRVLFAESAAVAEFADGVAFASLVGEGAWTFTADGREFFGADGERDPVALATAASWAERCGAGLDPCFAQRLTFELAPGESRVVTFLLGEMDSRQRCLDLVARYRGDGEINRALAEMQAFWRVLVGRLQVETPVPSIDVMLNGWLLYQNLSCRMWGRSAFYQSGGALGYRDQLQDSAALLYVRPQLTRDQIVLHAAHQFVEGDVLHWWHEPPLDRGLRTRFSDDLNWLPLATAAYVQATGDWALLAESVPFLRSRPLAEGEDEAYLEPEDSGEVGDVYDHCCRALDRSRPVGAHGLPLIGTGDWNDGMNRVGREGRGESVWMGFFLYYILGEFLPLCERRGDVARVDSYRRWRADLQASLETSGWDGEWYRRAYYDDGSPLGTSTDDECRIDALAQAWAVISGAATASRAVQAMQSAADLLVSEPEGIVRLLTPPFDRTPRDPGYIKGYVAGVRENGGQYTHAACWVVRAFAELGQHERAVRLLTMLSPVNHADTPAGMERYKLEPYVVAADVYGAAPHVGRGGWSWYTGSAGWWYRVAIESILGFETREGRWLRLAPRIPEAWPGFRLRYRLEDGLTSIDVRVTRSGAGGQVCEARLDGVDVNIENGAAFFPLLADGRSHRAELVLGSGEQGAVS